MLNPPRSLRFITLLMVMPAMAGSPLSVLAQQRMTGFSTAAAMSQADLERKFKSIPSPDEARKHHRLQRINSRIMQVESNWLNPDGIPGRPWFKHILYAARYTYAHLELPGLTEAIERSDWQAAAKQGKILEDALTANAGLLRAATSELNQMSSR